MSFVVNIPNTLERLGRDDVAICSMFGCQVTVRLRAGAGTIRGILVPFHFRDSSLVLHRRVGVFDAMGAVAFDAFDVAVILRDEVAAVERDRW